MELTRIFDEEEFSSALQAWRWIGMEGLTPWFASVFGDVFLIGDDGVYLLDIAAGELSREWSSPAEAKRVLGTDDGLDEYLLAGLAFAAADAGLEPQASQVFDYKVPPVLGGEFEVENLTVSGFEAVLHLTGRLHEQVKDLPEGAEVTGFDRA